MNDPNILGMMLNSPDGDPLAALRAAQEKLRAEEDEKKRIAEVEQMKAYRLEAMKKAAEEDPLGAAQQMLGQTRQNDPLQQVMQRAAQSTPLDKLAQTTPQELERQMYERVWGAPAKSKLGKVGKGVSEVLGMFSGLPKDFSKPAMDQFLKIQEQYRKERANDLSAMTQAAQITGRENTSKDKNLLDLFRAKDKSLVDRVKAADAYVKTDAYVDSVNNQGKWLAELPQLKREQMQLEAKKIAGDISNEAELAVRLKDLVTQGKDKEASLIRSYYIDAMQTRAGMNAASKGGGSSRTSTRETMIQGTVIDPQTGNAVKKAMPGPQLSTTTSTPPNPVGQAFMAQQPFGPPAAPASGAAKSYMSGQTEAPPVPKIQTPKANVTRYNAPDNPVKVAPKARPGYTPVSIVKVTPPGMMEFDMGGPSTLGTAKEFNKRKEVVAQLTDVANVVMDAYASGAADRVHGFLNQPASGLERGKSAWSALQGKLSGQSAGHAASQTTLNDITNRFKDDPEAQKYWRAIQFLQTKSLADYIQSVSGAQSAKEEAERLSQIFFNISDPPEVVLQRALNVAHRIGTIEAILGSGIGAQDITMSSSARERIRKDKLTALENRMKQAKLVRMTPGDKWKEFMPNAEDFDFNRFLAETEEGSGIKFKGVMFQGYDPAPSARQQLKSKLTPEDPNEVNFRKALDKYKKAKGAKK